MSKTVTVSILAFVAGAIVALALSGQGTSSSSDGQGGSADPRLNGAGSTFVEPLITKWAGSYTHESPGTQINYQGIGSGGGIQQFTAGTVHFAATDAPMTDEEEAEAQKVGGDVLHIPMTMGSVVTVYNLPGVDSLKLDGSTLAGIYLGEIEQWNDEAIAQLNPEVDLPDTSIRVVHRSDSSGTSFTFTSYLDAVSESWNNDVGADKAPAWPVGVGGQGNDGVAAAVEQTEGAIGYTEIAYALKNDIPFASLENAKGEFVTPSLQSTSAAAKDLSFPKDLKFSLVNSDAKGAYPIVGVTWILADQNQQDRAKGVTLVSFLKWALNDGQKEASSLLYAPLPDDLVVASLDAVNSINVR